jgi:hypothetical protein
VNEEVGSPVGFSPLQEKVAQVVSTKETFGLEPFYIKKGKAFECDLQLFYAKSLPLQVLSMGKVSQVNSCLMLLQPAPAWQEFCEHCS